MSTKKEEKKQCDFPQNFTSGKVCIHALQKASEHFSMFLSSAGLSNPTIPYYIYFRKRREVTKSNSPHKCHDNTEKKGSENFPVCLWSISLSFVSGSLVPDELTSESHWRFPVPQKLGESIGEFLALLGSLVTQKGYG